MLHLSPLESEIMNALARAKGWTPTASFQADSTVEGLVFMGMVETGRQEAVKVARPTPKGRAWALANGVRYVESQLARALKAKPVRVRHGKT